MSNPAARELHRWDVTPREAQAIQERLRGQVRLRSDLDQVRRVAGVDVCFPQKQARAAVVVLSFPDLQPLEQVLAQVPLTFPYIPGLLTFREGPAVLAAFERLTLRPDLLMFDGQGLAHPRRLGLACHLGLWLDLPSIGCAKSRLIGKHDEPGPDKGDWAPLRDGGETIGAVLRSRTRTRPLYVSPGHRVDLETSIHYVLACCPRYRLPETTRRADKLCATGNPPQGPP
ncbi:MAG: deoxyribonuclease V [Chloroflexia bacterium]|nr:deoxyribonuclease V [Chloroflexia bacterium]